MKTPVRYGFRLKDLHDDNKTIASFTFNTKQEKNTFVKQMAKTIENPKRYQAITFEEYNLDQ